MLYNEVISWLKNLNIGFVDRFAPYYVISAANHLVNLANYRNEFYREHGKVADLRLHVFLCSPPGFSKSFFLHSFLMGEDSVFGGSVIPTGFLGSITEAGMVGTIRLENGEPVIIKGAAHRYKDAILGIDEFSALTNIMKMEHSLNLDNALLTALDRGFIYKELALGEIKYQTHLTLWSNSQPTRMDLTSGLGRRFVYLYFMPTEKDKLLMKKLRRAGKGMKPHQQNLNKIYALIADMKEDIEKLESITFSEKIYDFYDEIGIPHYEEILYDRMALGYNLASKQKIHKNFTVDLSAELKRLIRQEHTWRTQIKIGPEDELVMAVIAENINKTITEIKRVLLDFGYSYAHSSKIIDDLVRQGRLVKIQQPIKRGRPQIKLRIVG